MARNIITDFRVKNEVRGKAGNVTILATFSVKLNYVTLRGFEIVQVRGKQPFISVPNNAYKKPDGTWDRYNFVVYEGDKGQQLQNEVQRQAMAELQRREGAVAVPADEPEDDFPF